MRDVIFKIINQFTKGVDTYHNNGSMWLIFTDDKKWVIELTKDGTLWYNFYFFQDSFKYLSLDVVENQHYITEWVESIIQNGVKSTDFWAGKPFVSVESIIQTGVINTFDVQVPLGVQVENTIQNGVRSTKFGLEHQPISVDYAIQNGVRETLLDDGFINFSVEDVIQNGIKEINHCSVSNDENAKNAIEFGIKETHEDSYHNKGRVDGVIRNEIKETKHGIHFFEDTTENVIKNGIKEVKELPDKSGELNGYGEYYARQKNMTYPHTDIVNDVITDGIKETNWRKVDNHPTYLDHILIEKDS